MNESAERILNLSNVSIMFGGLRAVSGFNFQMNKNELCGLIGPNGAGKTTIFNLITGVYKPTEGNIELAGELLNNQPSYEIVKKGIARTFQNIRLFGDLTVLDTVLVSNHMRIDYTYVDLLLRTRRFAKVEEEIRSEALDLLKIFNLDSRSGHKSSSLSYGNQRRLEIVRALATRPKILLLDEPAAGLNTKEKVVLMETIAEIRRRFNLAILVIEHDMKLVMGICERIVVLDHGEVIACGIPREIQSNPKVIEAYLGVD